MEQSEYEKITGHKTPQERKAYENGYSDCEKITFGFPIKATFIRFELI